MPKPVQYKLLVGMNYVPEGGKEEIRREIDDVVTDLPVKSIKTLLSGGYIEEVK